MYNHHPNNIINVSIPILSNIWYMNSFAQKFNDLFSYSDLHNIGFFVCLTITVSGNNNIKLSDINNHITIHMIHHYYYLTETVQF